MALSALPTYDEIWRYIVSFLPPISNPNPSPANIANYLQDALNHKRIDIMFVWNIVPENYVPQEQDYIPMVEADCVEGLKWLHAQKVVPDSTQMLKHCHVKCLKAICKEHLFDIHPYTPHLLAEGGQLKSLQWFIKHCDELVPKVEIRQRDHVCLSAAIGGSIECMKYADTHGYPIDIWRGAMFYAQGGHVECLKYAVENGCHVNTMENNDFENMYQYAIDADSVECVKYLHEVGCRLDEYVLKYAIRAEAVKCFEYLSTECPHTFNIIDYAVEQDAVKILDYLYMRDDKLREDVLKSIISHPNVKAIKYARAKGYDLLGADYEKYSKPLANDYSMQVFSEEKKYHESHHTQSPTLIKDHVRHHLLDIIGVQDSDEYMPAPPDHAGSSTLRCKDPFSIHNIKRISILRVIGGYSSYMHDEEQLLASRTAKRQYTFDRESCQNDIHDYLQAEVYGE